MLIDELLVSIGGIIIIVAWIPQLIKILRTKSSKDISKTFLIIIIIGTIMLIPHAVMLNDIYYILIYSIAAFVAILVLIAAIYYGGYNEK